MTLALHTCFRIIAALWVPLLCGAAVEGHVNIRDSRDPAVRKRADYSGVVVWCRPVNGPTPAKASSGHARMIQKDKTFTPHVLPILVGTTVDFPNFDPIFHNAFSSYNGQIFDVGLYPPGTDRAVHFKRPGVVRVFCNIHSSMSAVIVVLDTQYFAVTNSKGNFRIEDLPPGDYDVRVFHERAAPGTLRALDRRISVSEGTLVVDPISISESGYLPIPHKNKYGRDYGAEPDEHSIYPAVKK